MERPPKASSPLMLLSSRLRGEGLFNPEKGLDEPGPKWYKSYLKRGYRNKSRMPKWWNWQTRQVQGLVRVSSQEFESPLRHHNFHFREVLTWPWFHQLSGFSNPLGVYQNLKSFGRETSMEVFTEISGKSGNPGKHRPRIPSHIFKRNDYKRFCFTSMFVIVEQ